MNERPNESIGLPIREIVYRTDAENIYFVSSSGHCSLDCSYCIVNPIVKHQPSLNAEDIAFVIKSRPGKALLMFSGAGDFFAGYKKRERLLNSILEHNVEIALDINAVMIHEMPTLSADQITKIRFINVTMHYRQLKLHNAMRAWVENVLTICRLQRSEMFIIGYILSPSESGDWNEALEFYEKNIFASTGQRLVLIRDIHGGFDKSTETSLSNLSHRWSGMIEEIHQEYFPERFSQYPYVICPAGKNYFRVWNDGRIEGCPYIDSLRDCGNAKNRTISVRDDWFNCDTPNYCDCSAIAITGKMRYPDRLTDLRVLPSAEDKLKKVHWLEKLE
jgi:MoaA/NifB/PqqE/SkfB family radical SAM enzyme